MPDKITTAASITAIESTKRSDNSRSAGLTGAVKFSQLVGELKRDLDDLRVLAFPSEIRARRFRGDAAKLEDSSKPCSCASRADGGPGVVDRALAGQTDSQSQIVSQLDHARPFRLWCLLDDARYRGIPMRQVPAACAAGPSSGR